MVGPKAADHKEAGPMAIGPETSCISKICSCKRNSLSEDWPKVGELPNGGEVGLVKRGGEVGLVKRGGMELRGG
ncbi:hypothetical protein EV1_010196 [Malus domestica]